MRGLDALFLVLGGAALGFVGAWLWRDVWCGLVGWP